MPHKAFISYSSKDQKTAFKICDCLELKGIPCWIAPRDVKPAPTYAEQIVDAIESCSATVLVLSEHSNTSTHVRNEIERVASKGKPIIPVRIQSIKPSKQLELYISAYQWIDVWPPHFNEKMENLAEAIKTIVHFDSDKNDNVNNGEDSGTARRSSQKKFKRMVIVSALSALGLAALVYTASSFFKAKPVLIQDQNITQSTTVDTTTGQFNSTFNTPSDSSSNINLIKPVSDSRPSRSTEKINMRKEESAVTANRVPNANRMTFAVLGFENIDQSPADEKGNWRISNLIRFQLSGSPLIDVANRSRVESTVADHHSRVVGLTELEKGLAYGRILGVQKVVQGEYLKNAAGQLGIRIQLVDVVKGRIERNWTKEIMAEEELDPFISQTVKDILDAVQYEKAIQTLAQLQNPVQPFHVEVKCTKETLKIGEIYSFSVKPDADCYINILDFGTSGKISVLYPNKMQPDNFVKANEVLWTPDLRVAPPVGLEKVKIIATRERIPIVDVIKLANQKSPFLGVSNHEVSEFSRDLELTLNPLSKDNWSESTMEIKIVE